MPRRILVVTLLILALLLAVSACGKQETSRSEPLETLRLTYNPLPFNLPSMVMRSEGLLEQQLVERGLEGVTLEHKTFEAGFNMSEAMATGQLDIATVTGFTSAVMAKAGGRDLKVVAAYSRAPSAFALAVPAGDTALPADIRGWKIALPIGTEAHYLLGRILDEQGLSFEDVEIVNMLVPDAAAALLSGNVDGAVLVEPVLSRLEAGDKIRVYRDGQGLVLGMTVTAVWGGFLADHPDAVAAYLAAVDDSLALIKANQEETLALAVQETGLPQPVVAKLMQKYNFSPVIDEDAIEAMEDQIDFLFEAGLIKERINLGDLLSLGPFS